ncbi:SRPBCC family protein [Streptomyces sp. NPDC012461]|uniref:SRPBCC family protein n=1 Tax=Streptomyces sp. NPDC012461 TaxID=3155117 RepID=UPI0033FBD190
MPDTPSALRAAHATATGPPPHPERQSGPAPRLEEVVVWPKSARRPAEIVWTVEEVEPARVPAVRGTGPMPVGVTTRYTLVPDGSGTTVRIDGTFTGATVSPTAARLTESATAALQQSLRSLDALLT